MNGLIAGLVGVQELHKPVFVGTRDGEPVYRCMTCISIEVPCATRRLADDALGGDNNG